MPDRLPETDNEILALFHLDRESAWRLIYKRCHAKSMRFMNSHFRAGFDKEDVFQEACLVLLDRMETPSFTLTCSLQVFLNAICRNILLKQHRRQPINTSISSEFELDLVVDVEIEEEEHSIRESIFFEVIELMRTQAERCYEIFQLVYFRNLGMQQIADRLGISTAANVRIQKHRCLVNARNEIERRINQNRARR
ncbi:sigma-70 family RNA polymerase sigma factor [Aquirufa sp. HETE-83D]|jgi:RNA polymerase sigma factor (sigma-70 family)|uniref:Sigma-70 family RNA polymerase sigma factor n=1 Tax=Aquirufa esocilacus TaxID=3096513 RepID=A0ABW6DHZ4_9BACT